MAIQWKMLKRSWWQITRWRMLNVMTEPEWIPCHTLKVFKFWTAFKLLFPAHIKGSDLMWAAGMDCLLLLVMQWAETKQKQNSRFSFPGIQRKHIYWALVKFYGLDSPRELYVELYVECKGMLLYIMSKY